MRVRELAHTSFLLCLFPLFLSPSFSCYFNVDLHLIAIGFIWLSFLDLDVLCTPKSFACWLGNVIIAHRKRTRKRKKMGKFSFSSAFVVCRVFSNARYSVHSSIPFYNAHKLFSGISIHRTIFNRINYNEQKMRISFLMITHSTSFCSLTCRKFPE